MGEGTTRVESTRNFYERRLREEWEKAGGTTHGPFFYHPRLPGCSFDSRSGWGVLVRALLQQESHGESTQPTGE